MTADDRVNFSFGSGFGQILAVLFQSFAASAAFSGLAGRLIHTGIGIVSPILAHTGDFSHHFLKEAPGFHPQLRQVAVGKTVRLGKNGQQDVFRSHIVVAKLPGNPHCIFQGTLCPRGEIFGVQPLGNALSHGSNEFFFQGLSSDPFLIQQGGSGAIILSSQAVEQVFGADEGVAQFPRFLNAQVNGFVCFSGKSVKEIHHNSSFNSENIYYNVLRDGIFIQLFQKLIGSNPQTRFFAGTLSPAPLQTFKKV